MQNTVAIAGIIKETAKVRYLCYIIEITNADMNWLIVGLVTYFSTGTVTSITAIWLLIRYRNSKQLPYSKAGAALMLSCAIWVIAEAVEMLTSGYGFKVLWDHIEYTGVYLIAPAWLFFVIQFTGRKQLISRRRWINICIIPVICLILLFTNPLHKWIWTMGNPTPLLVPFEKTYGVLYYVISGLLVLQFLVGAYWLLGMLGKAQAYFRRQSILIALLMLIPLCIRSSPNEVEGRRRRGGTCFPTEYA